MKTIRAALELALGPLPESDLHALTQQVTISSYPAESIIFEENDVEYILYIIQEGNVAFTKQMDTGDQLLGYKGAGEFFGELGVLDHAPRAATVTALTDCKLLQLHEQALDDIIARNPSVSRAIMRGLTRSMRDTDQITIAKLQFTNAELEQINLQLATTNTELAETLHELKTAQEELLRRERFKRDAEIAATVHQSILPTAFPQVPNFEFAAAARPAREIGGDLYDVIPVDPNQIALVMADASGKSVQAAIYMAVVKALFLSQSQPDASPAQVAHRVHNLLMRASTAEMFVTVFYAKLNLTTRRMTYIRGGHDRPVFYQAHTQTTRLLDVPGRFLGLLPDLIVEEETLTFNPGDTLVCYSDGVTDATRNGDDDTYGLKRLQSIIQQEGYRSAQELVDVIIQDIDHFRDQQEQPDDLTLMVIKRI